MQKKSLFLFGLISLLSFGPAWAAHEHNHDGHGPDFSIGSADGNYKLGIGGLLQERNEISYTTAVGATPGRTAIDLSLPNARINIHGSAFDPSFTYFFQANFSEFKGDSRAQGNLRQRVGTGGYGRLLDYYVEKAVHARWAHVRVGKFVLPFSRQLMTSAAFTQFGKLSVASANASIIDDNHDIGVMVHNGVHHEFEYALALVNSGIVGRLGFNHGHVDGYHPTDFAGGDLRFGVGISAFIPTNYTSFNPNYVKGAGDVIVKYRHFSANGVFYFARGFEGVDQDKTRLGAGLDLGYLINEKCEPVVRYSWAASDDDTKAHEITLGLNHYSFGNHLKSHLFLGAELQDSRFAKVLGGLQLQFAL